MRCIRTFRVIPGLYVDSPHSSFSLQLLNHLQWECAESRWRRRSRSSLSWRCDSFLCIRQSLRSCLDLGAWMWMYIYMLHRHALELQVEVKVQFELEWVQQVEVLAYCNLFNSNWPNSNCLIELPIPIAFPIARTTPCVTYTSVSFTFAAVSLSSTRTTQLDYYIYNYSHTTITQIYKYKY